MGLDAVWQQGAYTGYQVWVWLRYEASHASVHIPGRRDCYRLSHNHV